MDLTQWYNNNNTTPPPQPTIRRKRARPVPSPTQSPSPQPSLHLDIPIVASPEPMQPSEERPQSPPRQPAPLHPNHVLHDDIQRLHNAIMLLDNKTENKIIKMLSKELYNSVKFRQYNPAN